MDKELLNQGIYYFHAKNIDEARKIFLDIAKKYPEEELSWTWLAACAPTKDAASSCLKKAFEINPTNPKTRDYLIKLGQTEFVQSQEAKNNLTSRLNLIESEQAKINTSLPTEKFETPKTNTINSKDLLIQPSSMPEERTSPGKVDTTVNKLVNDDKLFKTIVIGFVVVIVLIAAFFIIPPLLSSGLSKNEKALLTEFLREGETLISLTEQGVTNNDFSNQLAKVKSAYRMVSDSIPTSYSAAKSNIDSAIIGWDLVLVVWDLELKKGQNFTGNCIINNVDSPALFEYVNVSYTDLACADFVSRAMSVAGNDFIEGKSVMMNLIK